MSPEDVITKTQRWLDLIAFLVKRRLPVAVDELMDGVPAYREKWSTGDANDRAAVRRMFERDKDELRDLGVPIRSVPYSIDYGAEEVTGYRLARQDFYLPYLRVLRQAGADRATGGPGRAGGAGGDTAPGTEPTPNSTSDSNSNLNSQSNSISNSNSNSISNSISNSVELHEDDASAAIDALTRVASLPNSPFRDAARSALRKLAFDVDVDALATAPVLFAEPPAPPGGEDLRGRIQSLLDAVRARKKVAFRYHGIYRDTVTHRDVAPYGLLFHHGHWYLVGHDDLRDDLRVFRLGRMDDVAVNASAPKTPDYEVPDDFDLADLAGRRPWELGEDSEPVTARVRFEFPTSLWADRNSYGTLTEALEGGAAVRELAVHQPDPFLRWVLGQAGDATVVGPPELVAAYRDLVGRTAAVYADAEDGSDGGDDDA